MAVCFTMAKIEMGAGFTRRFLVFILWFLRPFIRVDFRIFYLQNLQVFSGYRPKEPIQPIPRIIIGELKHPVIDGLDLGQIHPSQGQLTSGLSLFLTDIVGGTDQPLLIHISLEHHINVSIFVKEQASRYQMGQACRHPSAVFD